MRSLRLRPALLAVLLLAGIAEGLPAQPPTLRVIEIRGDEPGPTVALVAGVHGGKVSASIALERLAARLRADRAGLRGRVRIVPVANEAARAAGLAQLAPDSLNLNRVFPGRRDGRPTERLAARILVEVVRGADYLVDLHGSDGEEAVGRFAYAARPGLRPAVDSAALELARAWGVPLVVWDTAGPRTLATSRYLQTAAHLLRVPAITVFEAGTEREEDAAIEAFTRGAERVLGSLGVLVREVAPTPAFEVRAAREVVTASGDGDWRPAPGLRPGVRVAAGEVLGSLSGHAAAGSPRDDAVRAPVAGLVLHLRQARAGKGNVREGTPLVILAAEAP
jgi:predicted deacylase